MKLDTLPFRSGDEAWLDDALQRIETNRLFGMTGGTPFADLVPLEDGYSTTQKFSNNFSIFRRSDWLKAVQDCIGDGSTEIAGSVRFQGNNLRFINEYALETHLEQTGARMLVKHDSQGWSVFHVNVWGEALQNVRTAYLERQAVERFFNTGKPLRRSLEHPWQKYYGFPSPPTLRLMRIALGKWRRCLFGRRS